MAVLLTFRLADVSSSRLFPFESMLPSLCLPALLLLTLVRMLLSLQHSLSLGQYRVNGRQQ